MLHMAALAVLRRRKQDLATCAHKRMRHNGLRLSAAIGAQRRVAANVERAMPPTCATILAVQRIKEWCTAGSGEVPTEVGVDMEWRFGAEWVDDGISFPHPCRPDSFTRCGRGTDDTMTHDRMCPMDQETVARQEGHDTRRLGVLDGVGGRPRSCREQGPEDRCGHKCLSWIACALAGNRRAGNAEHHPRVFDPLDTQIVQECFVSVRGAATAVDSSPRRAPAGRIGARAGRPQPVRAISMAERHSMESRFMAHDGAGWARRSTMFDVSRGVPQAPTADMYYAVASLIRVQP